MQVTVKYHDNESFLLEEVIKQARTNYGAAASVTVTPESDTPIDYLYFALQRLFTADVLKILYENGDTYQKDLEKLRSEMMYKVGEVLNEVIMDIEHKIQGD